VGIIIMIKRSSRFGLAFGVIIALAIGMLVLCPFHANALSIEIEETSPEVPEEGTVVQEDAPPTTSDAPDTPEAPGTTLSADPAALTEARNRFAQDATLENKYLLIDQLRAEAVAQSQSDLLTEALVLACQTPTVDGAQLELQLDQYRKLSLKQRHQQLVEQIENGESIDSDLTAESVLTRTADLALVAKLLDYQGNDTFANTLRQIASDRHDRLSAPALLEAAHWLAPLIDDAPTYRQPALRHQLLQIYQRYLLVGIPDTDDYIQARSELLKQFDRLDTESATSAQAPLDRWLALSTLLDIQDLPNANRWTVDPRTGYLNSTSKLTMGRFPLTFGPAEYDLQIRFRAMADRTGLHIFFPIGNDRIARLSMDRRQDNLNDLAYRPGVGSNGDIHTVTIHVRQRLDKQYVISADMDGQPYFPARLFTGTQENRLPTPQRDLARQHILLRALSGACEIQAVNLRMVSGTASVPLDAQPSSDGPELREITIDARESWQWIMQVRPGDVLQIDAEGQWSPGEDLKVGPDGDDFGWYALRGRLVEADKTFNVGDSTILVVQRDDILKLEMDDSNRSDNSGHMKVTIQRFSLPDTDDLDDSAPDTVDPFAGLATQVDTTASEDMELLFGPSPYTIAQAQQMLTLAPQVSVPELRLLLLTTGMDRLQAGGEPFPIGVVPLMLALTPERFPGVSASVLDRCRDELLQGSSPRAIAALQSAGDYFARTHQWDQAIRCYGDAAASDPQLSDHVDLLKLGKQAQASWADAPDNTTLRDEYLAILLTVDADLTNTAFDQTTQEHLALQNVAWDDLDPADAMKLARWYEGLSQSDLPTPARTFLLSTARQYCSEVLANTPAPDPRRDSAKALDASCFEALVALLGAENVPQTVAPIGRSRLKQFTVYANQEWQPGIEVKAGDTVTLEASGRWTVFFGGGQNYICGPEGRVFNEGDPPAGDLICRINEGPHQSVGNTHTFTVEEDGTLMFRISDASPHDNWGTAKVTIRIEPKRD
jgi:hypothetical protein